MPGRTAEPERIAHAVGDDPRAFGRARRRSGCRAAPAPVAGSTRRSAPSKLVGSANVRRSWLRSAPPFGGRRRQDGADAARRIAARIQRAAVLAVVDEVEARAVAAADVERAIGAEVERPHRVARILLAPVLDQHLLGSDHRVAGRRQPGEAAAHDAAVGRRSGWRRAPVGRRARRAPARRGAADRRVVGVQHVHVRVVRKAGVEGEAEQSRGPRSCGPGSSGRRRRRAVESVSESNTLTRPLFSATKTRPSEAKRTAVGLVSPVNTVRSENPGGYVAARAVAGCRSASRPATTASRARTLTGSTETKQFECSDFRRIFTPIPGVAVNAPSQGRRQRRWTWGLDVDGPERSGRGRC